MIPLKFKDTSSCFALDTSLVFSVVLDDALGTGVPVSDITCVGLPDTSSSSSSPS